MKKFKYLILLFVLCLTCSFTNAPKKGGTFICDFGQDMSEFTGVPGSTYEFNYGQKFICAYARDHDGEIGVTDFNICQTVNGENYVTINSKDDFIKIAAMNDDVWDSPLSYQKRTFFPIDDFILEGTSTFNYLYEVTTSIFGNDLQNQEMEYIDYAFQDMYNKNTSLVCREVAQADNMKPVIDGYNGFYVTNVNNPASIEEIKSHIRAIDDVDGDISSNIQIDKDEYSDYKKIKGDHKIIFSATDEAGNKATLNLTVRVVDTDKPVFDGPDNFSSFLSHSLDISEITSKIKVSDNYDKEISYTYDDKYTPHKGEIGTYDITFTATDTSNNTQTKVVKVRVIDDIKPVISGPAKYETNVHGVLNIDEIKNALTAKDNVDKTCDKSKIELVSNDYNPKHVGTYHATFKVSDASGNESEIFTVTINVVDKNKPIFFIDEFIINLEKDISMSNEEIISLLGESNTIKMDKISNKEKQIVVVKDEYKESNEEGSYKMNLKITYDSGDVQDLNVVINRLGNNVSKLSKWDTFVANLVFYSMKIDQFFDDLYDTIYYFFYNLFH